MISKNCEIPLIKAFLSSDRRRNILHLSNFCAQLEFAAQLLLNRVTLALLGGLINSRSQTPHNLNIKY